MNCKSFAPVCTLILGMSLYGSPIQSQETTVPGKSNPPRVNSSPGVASPNPVASPDSKVGKSEPTPPSKKAETAADKSDLVPSETGSKTVSNKLSDDKKGVEKGTPANSGPESKKTSPASTLEGASAPRTPSNPAAPNPAPVEVAKPNQSQAASGAKTSSNRAERAQTLRDLYQDRIVFGTQYSTLQIMPIQADMHLTGGTIGQDWAKKEMPRVGIDAAKFLADQKFDREQERLIGGTLISRLFVESKEWGYDVYTPYLAIQSREQPAPQTLDLNASEWNSKVVKADGSPRVYVVEAGTRRWIPDIQTLQLLGFDAQTIVNLDAKQSALVPEGPPLTQYWEAIKSADESQVFIHLEGKRYFIPDHETFELVYHLDATKVRIISGEELAKIPLVGGLPSIAKPWSVFKSETEADIFLVQNGFKHHIPDTATFVECGMSPNQIRVLPFEVMERFAMGAPLPSVLGKCESPRFPAPVKLVESPVKTTELGPTATAPKEKGSTVESDRPNDAIPNVPSKEAAKPTSPPKTGGNASPKTATPVPALPKPALPNEVKKEAPAPKPAVKSAK